ncbi:hypothetical protein [Sphingobacterium athyrii]|uniref:Uncharacterized protein n=1 Tax=Sphingobacterium athyrii TaxID=2152717 RepID=A0A363NJX1_9SPHI|nr:hypothetical protein [Sphingobacterium athyrii]PUV21065.1 hypothetical protein DCO56_28800 [Sphingobacterium athyrii]
MFNFFKRNSLSSHDLVFLKCIVECLPDKYSYLKPQVTEDFIIGKKINKHGALGAYVFTLNAKLESHFLNTNLPEYFIIKDIRVFDTKLKRYNIVEFDILQGMLAGYYLNGNIKDLDLSKIDTSHIKEKNFKDQDKNNLRMILGGSYDEVVKLLDLKSTFHINVSEGDFYVINDFGDGNYLAINSQGAIYGLIHDPYEIQKIFDSPEALLNGLKKGTFNPELYYQKKVK